MSATVKRPKAATKIWTSIAALLALHMLSTPFAVYLLLADHGPTWLGLDDSARMALNWAWSSGADWGHDIVYTYGPLSFLSTKVGWGISPVVFLISDLFVVFNFFFLFRDFIVRSRYPWLGVITAILITLSIPTFYGSGLAWVLTVFIFYWMWKSYDAPRLWHFAMSVVLITLAFYLKLNTGLFTIVFLLAHLALMVYAKKISLAAAGGTLAGLAILIGGGAFAFHVSLPAYVKGAMEVVKGYNDLLYLYEGHHEDELRILCIYWIVSGALGIGLLSQIRRRGWVAAFLLIVAAAYLFLLKKQAIFRNDEQHLQEFFSYAPLVLLCGVGNLVWPQRKGIVAVAICLITAATILLGAGARPGMVIGPRLLERYSVLFRYPREVAAYDAAGYANQANKRLLPPRLMSRIGKGTIDVFPWDANYALQNGLNYHPRPCFQTFQANSDYLQQINYDFYAQRGPRFVIYDYDGIDGAYPFNDAPTLNLFLARNYRMADTFTGNERWRILLERKADIDPLSLTPGVEKTAALGQAFPVAGALFLRLRVSYTLKGKARAIWYKPAPLTIAYQRANGDWEEHKTSAELLKTGLYVGRFIKSNQEFARFVAGDTVSLERIKAIKLIGDPGHYSDAIGITECALQ